jgi:ATP-dependent helicase YprA (DUF1998 family)
MDEDPLIAARAAATERDGYDSVTTREQIKTQFKSACSGKTPYDWQVDVTEALILGLDSIVIAGTGSGKTMPFGMLALTDLSRKKMVLVISPLNALEHEQAERFHAMGLTATAVNSDVYTPKLHKVCYCGYLQCW